MKYGLSKWIKPLITFNTSHKVFRGDQLSPPEKASTDPIKFSSNRGLQTFVSPNGIVQSIFGCQIIVWQLTIGNKNGLSNGNFISNLKLPSWYMVSSFPLIIQHKWKSEFFSFLIVIYFLNFFFS